MSESVHTLYIAYDFRWRFHRFLLWWLRKNNRLIDPLKKLLQLSLLLFLKRQTVPAFLLLLAVR